MTEPAAPATPNYKDTLNLPQTNFDMKANLTQREPVMVAKWQTENLYKKIRTAPHPKGKWVLHDGPPYANGDIHMGHLLNKVLKDITIKFRTMQGHDSPYVPGWDCHGLPIESAIQKELGPKFRELSKPELRQKCHDYAMKYVKLQGDSFQRLGILGEFENPYLTLDHRYESGILDVLAELVQRDLVYRQKKPVHWCVNDRTALAEAELEYQNKKDTSIYVLFRLSERNFKFNKQREGNETLDLPANTPIDLMIWTTTPWTLPANRAVAASPESSYALVQYKDAETVRSVIVAEQLVEKVFNVAGISGHEVIGYVSGETFGRTMPWYMHPLDSREQPLLTASFVTMEDGTGLVHIAPGHGKEDYSLRADISRAHNMRTTSTVSQQPEDAIYNPVLADGKYDDTVPEFLRGKSIWDANQLVIDKLRENGTLFHAQQFDHEYPHCWRCKKPVIFRATEQWFVKADHGNRLYGVGNKNEVLHAKSLDQDLPEPSNLWLTAYEWVRKPESTTWIPPWGRHRIASMLATRPDWCISRQRSWGVPIPAFFDAQGKTLLNEKSVRRIAGYFKEHGADSWYTHTPAQLLGVDPAKPAQGLQSLGFNADVDVTKLDKGHDILDVWFESGASHHAVLECTHPELGYPANMYLEGSDQHRGWFQSSLLEASGYKAEPPFKQVLTHGFIVDEKGKKMSKSEGNDIKVNDALKQYGADVLRLWVSSVDYQNDIACGPNLLKNMGEAYRKIRNTIRYLLGNLYDFNPNEHITEPAPHSIDRWMQNRVNAWASDVHTAYDTYEFHNVFKRIYEFCNVEISAIYAKAIKDRLYCELPNSAKRRASQTVCYRALVHLIELCAPVLVFTADESWAALRELPGCGKLEASVHLHQLSEISNLRSDEAADRHWSLLMPLVEEANKQLDELKKSVGGKYNTSDAELTIIVPAVADEVSPHIAAYGLELEDLLGVGHHRVEHGETWSVKIHDATMRYPSCARSWKRRPDVGSNPAYPDLSARDAQVVSVLRGG